MAYFGDYIEERTPKGFTLKIITKKMNYLAFDRNGATVYSDAQGMNVMHNIPSIFFFGESFSVKSPMVGEFNMLKMSSGKLVVPYYIEGGQGLQYHLLDTGHRTDLVPARIFIDKNVNEFIRDIDLGIRPDYLFVDKRVHEHDVVIIKNRCGFVKIIYLEPASGRREYDEYQRRAADEVIDINLNMMSTNPVFLARLHLRNVALVKVRQLLLDFDLVKDDAEFIMTFIQAMIKKEGTSPEIDKNIAGLKNLEDEFKLYLALFTKNKEDVTALISTADSPAKISSYHTLLAKVRSMHDERGTDLMFTEIENLLLEKQDGLK